MRTAVVGHVEWVTFGRVDRVPTAGEIVHATDTFDVPAGGGAVAAVQLRKLAGDCMFFTALGDDDLGHRALGELSAMGVRVEAVFRTTPQRRAFAHVDANGERTITVMGARLGPHGDDPLPWRELDTVDAVFFCAGDDDAFRHARRAQVLVATTREAERIARVGQYVDAVVGSAKDPSERYIDTSPTPGLVVETLGAAGGRYRGSDGTSGVISPGKLPGEIVCAYGAGDSFVAGLTYALGAGFARDEAFALAADCGAACLTGRGPYEAQLTSSRMLGS